MPEVHARFSPSAFGRLIQCPASLKMCEALPNNSTVYSRTGTSAHSLGENLIKVALGEADPIDPTGLEGYDEKMQRNMEAYRDFVMERFQKVKTERGDAWLLVEQRVNVPGVGKKGEECFGTSDAVILSKNYLEIVDYKNGVTPVSPVENPQLMAYAYGAESEYGLIWGEKDICLSIFQPNIDNVESWNTDISHVTEWMEETLVPASKEALKKNPKGCAGPYCKFCAAKARCGWQAQLAHEIAVKEFCTPDKLLENGDISHFLGVADRLEDWIKSLREYALTKALEGEKLPGWKVVEGKSTRTWADEGKAGELIALEGVDPYRPKELKTLTEIEKLVGKEKMKQWLDEGVLIKPKGKPTLAVDTDGRPEWNQAEVDFADELKTEKEK